MTTSSSSKHFTISILSLVGVVFTLSAVSTFDDVRTGRGSILHFFGPILSALSCFFLAFLVYKDLQRFKAVEDKLNIAKKEEENIRAKEIRTVIEKISKAENEAGFKAIEFTYLGGTGNDWKINEPALMTFSSGNIWLTHPTSGYQKLLEIDRTTTIEISGPGTQTTNAGISGGGFGLEGFVKGVAVATAINAITTKSSTNTFLRVLSSRYEGYFHTSNMEPTNLRLTLSPAFVYIEEKKGMHEHSATKQLSIGDEIEKLDRLRASGALSHDEFTAAKAKLLAM